MKQTVTKVAFASRGYRIDQPLAIAPRDLPNTFTDIAASTLLANLCTDAYRSATRADIGFSVNGMMRAGLIRGKSGVQTVYDVFAVAPLGAGVVDTTAGSTLVTGCFTGQELKNMLEFFLVDNPAHPGEYFPRASGLKIHYNLFRPKVEALDDPRSDTPDLLPPGGTLDQSSVDAVTENGAVREIKEWQAIMDHLRRLPAKPGELPVIPVDARANEVRVIRAG